MKVSEIEVGKEGLQRRWTSTYWGRVLFRRERLERSDARACPKRWRLSLKPCGRTVQVNCWDVWVLGSVQVKAKRSWESRQMGVVKNASLRSKIVKYMMEGGMVERRVCGLGMTGWMGTTASLIILRS